MSSRKRVPFELTLEVRDSCYCLHLQRAARTMARRYDEALRPFALTNNQFSLLMALNAREGATMARVTALLGMDRTTLTAALKVLERRGLAKITVSAGDKRGRDLALTESGHALLLDAYPVWKRTQAATESHVPNAHAAQLRADLAALGGFAPGAGKKSG